MQKYSATCGFVWVWNLISLLKKGVQAYSVWKKNDKNNIWMYEKDRGMSMK
jgi:hypothetical protein